MATMGASPVKRRRGPVRSRLLISTGGTGVLEAPSNTTNEITSSEALKNALSMLCQSLLEEFRKAVLQGSSAPSNAIIDVVPSATEAMVMGPLNDTKDNGNAVLLIDSTNNIQDSILKKRSKRIQVKKINGQRKRSPPPLPPSFLPLQGVDDATQVQEKVHDQQILDIKTNGIVTKTFGIDSNCEPCNDSVHVETISAFDANSPLQANSAPNAVESQTVIEPPPSLLREQPISQRTRLGVGLKLPPPPPFPVAPIQQKPALSSIGASKGEKLRQAIAALSSEDTLDHSTQIELEQGDSKLLNIKSLSEKHTAGNVADGTIADQLRVESSLGSPILKTQQINLKENDDVSKILESPILHHSSPIVDRPEAVGVTLNDDNDDDGVDIRSTTMQVTSPTGVPIWPTSGSAQEASPLRLSPAANRKRPIAKMVPTGSLRYRTHNQGSEQKKPLNSSGETLNFALKSSLNSKSKPLVGNSSSSSTAGLDDPFISSRGTLNTGTSNSQNDTASFVDGPLIRSCPTQKENSETFVQNKRNDAPAIPVPKKLPLELFSASKTKLALLGANSPKQKNNRMEHGITSPVPRTTSQTISKIKNKVAALLSSSTRVVANDVVDKLATPLRSKYTPIKTPVSNMVTPVSLKAINSSCIKQHQTMVPSRSPAQTPITRTRGTKPSECKPIWIITPNLRRSLVEQSSVNPESIFGNMQGGLSLERKYT